MQLVTLSLFAGLLCFWRAERLRAVEGRDRFDTETWMGGHRHEFIRAGSV